MATLFITCVLHCCTQVMAPSPDWTDHDKAALGTARNTCRRDYPQSSCLVKFKRVEESVYTAICGKENN